MVCAVVVFAPLTMASASPSCTIIVAKYVLSRTSSRACSRLTPLLLRASKSAAVKRSAYSFFSKFINLAPFKFTPSFFASNLTSFSSPKRIKFTAPLFSKISLALSIRSSSLSGKTMVFLSFAASLNSELSKRKGVIISCFAFKISSKFPLTISLEFRVKKLKFSRQKTGTFKFLAICKFSSILPIPAIPGHGLTTIKSALSPKALKLSIISLKSSFSLPFRKAFSAAFSSAKGVNITKFLEFMDIIELSKSASRARKAFAIFFLW